MPTDTNPAERRRWNDDRWTGMWPRRERFTGSVTPHLMDALSLTPGERVLDVGCGGGKTTIAAGRLVGSAGAAVGADISVPLVDLARRRAAEAGATNVTFQVVDMQYASIGDTPFDVALSQFGVMFFDEPVTAFANIGRHLRAGARIGFACWQEPARNPWFSGFALARFVPPIPPAPAGKSPTGPFALADAERTEGILRTAGFTEIRRTAVDQTVEVPEDAIVDDDQLAFMGVAGADMADARRAVDEHMASFRIESGLCRFPMAFQIFEARRPS